MKSINRQQRREGTKGGKPIPVTAGKRQRIFKIVLVVFPFILLILSEIALRAFEYGGNLDLFVKKRINGKEFYAINPMVGRRYFMQKHVTPMVSEDVFDVKKSPDAFRIFCLGESSTFGYPYMHNGSFPSLLKDRLKTLFPSRHIEMVNVGMPAVSSYSVLDFAKEIVNYQPDLLIVYTGHNEFYGALGVGSTESLGKNRSFIHLYLKLRKSRLFLLVRDFVAGLRTMFISSEEPSQESTLMETMVKEKYIGLQSEEYKTARDAFHENLDEIIEVAQENKVAILVSGLVSNLKDQPPFVSLFSDSVNDSQRKIWENAYSNGLMHEERGDFQDALQEYNEAIRIDRQPAKLHYQMGQCYDANGDTNTAKEELELARDLDGLRFRASSEFNSVIRDASLRRNVPYVDMDRAFAKMSRHGIVGKELMLEHLHPNLDGYFLMAKEFCRAIMQHDLVLPQKAWNPSLDKSDDEYWQMACVTDLDSAAARIRMKILTSSWPFTEGRKRATYHPVGLVEQLALDYCHQKISWEQAVVKLGEYYSGQKSYDQAAAEYLALKKATPYNVSPYLILGDIYLEQGEYGKAEDIWIEALTIEVSPIAHERLGTLYIRKSVPDKALQHLQEAIALDPKASKESQIWRRYCLGVAYAQMGKVPRATEEISRVLALDPNYALAKEMLQQLQKPK